MTETTNPLHQLFAEEWEARLETNPLLATYIGDRRYNDRLPRARDEDMLAWLEVKRAFRERLETIDRGALSPTDQLNYDVFARLSENEIRELEFHAYRLPICKAFGFHMDFGDLPAITPLENTRDYENYIARLAAFERYAQDHIALMRVGIREGYLPARVTLEGVDESLRAHIVADPKQSALYAPFENFPQGIGGADRDRLAEAGRDAIHGSVVPGYQAVLDFLVGEYLPAARQSIAAADMPDGRAFYEHRVRYYTSLELTPEQVHHTGLEEVSRIRAEMDGIRKVTGFEGGFRDFIEFLRSDPRFYAESPDALLKEVAYVLKRMDGELPRLFKTLPRLPYGIRPIPDFSAPGNTTAYYQPGAGDGSRAGVYYVNTYDLKSRPLYEIEALSLHEAVPGHHLQIALQQELELPEFRRFGGFTAFVEGWALYAERLGLEVGFYTDPYSDFGRLSYEMWRACRLVVDTGMHALGWGRQQAIDYMAENTSSTLLNITNEIDRYIAWPGQALAYKIGEIKMRELRARAEAQTGSRFDERDFHDVVLGSGAVPLDVLERMIDAWIATQKDERVEK